MGAKYTEKFSKQNTHLVVSEPLRLSVKIRKAEEWGIPIISAKWFEACLAKGDMLGVQDFQVKLEGKHQPTGHPVRVLNVAKYMDQLSIQAKKEITDSFSACLTKGVGNLPDLNVKPEKRKCEVTTFYSTSHIETPEILEIVVPRKTKQLKRTSQTQLNREDQLSPKANCKDMCAAVVGYTDTDAKAQQENLLSGNMLATKRFAFSGLSSEMRASQASMIVALGGIVEKSEQLVPGTTHLITSKSSLSEKFLCACAAGLDIVRPGYIEACAQAKQFVAETPYLLDESLFWKKKPRPFEHWIVDVVMSKGESFKRVLQAGGAVLGSGPDARQFRDAPPHNASYIVSLLACK